MCAELFQKFLATFVEKIWYKVSLTKYNHPSEALFKKRACYGIQSHLWYWKLCWKTPIKCSIIHWRRKDLQKFWCNFADNLSKWCCTCFQRTKQKLHLKILCTISKVLIKSAGTIYFYWDNGWKVWITACRFFKQMKVRQPVGSKILYKPSYQELGD